MRGAETSSHASTPLPSPTLTTGGQGGKGTSGGGANGGKLGVLRLVLALGRTLAGLTTGTRVLSRRDEGSAVAAAAVASLAAAEARLALLGARKGAGSEFTWMEGGRRSWPEERLDWRGVGAEGAGALTGVLGSAGRGRASVGVSMPPKRAWRAPARASEVGKKEVRVSLMRRPTGADLDSGRGSRLWWREKVLRFVGEERSGLMDLEMVEVETLRGMGEGERKEVRRGGHCWPG